MSRRLLAICIVAGLGLSACSSPTPPPPDGADTTSHQFSWSAAVFGDGGSSILYDVAIVNDTLIYAVGEIRLRDSSGVWDPVVYNLARWLNGTWSIHRASANFRGSVITPPLYGVLAISATDVWLCGGGVVFRGSENQWTPYDVRQIVGFDSLSIERAWGRQGSKIYFVGRSGCVAVYDGNAPVNEQWRRIQSGTLLDIQDIWGASAGPNDQPEVIAVASRLDIDLGKALLRISPQSVTSLSDSGLPWSLTGVWFVPNDRYYVTGDGLYFASTSSPTKWDGGANVLTSFYTARIRGNGSNDVFAVGAFGEVLHYNGSTWKSFRAETIIQDGSYGGLAVQEDLVVTVGADGPFAVATIGRR